MRKLKSKGWLLLSAAWLLVLSGCGARENAQQGARESADMAAGAQSPASPSVGAAQPQGKAAEAPTGGSPGSNAPGNAASLVKAVSAVPRKIIYTAEVSLAAKDLSQTQQKLLVLVAKYQGYVAESNVGGASGAPRQGSWKVRLPVDNYDKFMVEIAKIAEVQTIRSDSQDVSEEYYDLQARITNKQVEEKRLLEHLRSTTAKLEDILTVEREISRVRGEIEQMQGRLRVLANMTALATVSVSINEVQNYEPPAPLEPPTFSSRVASTFGQSWESLVQVGQLLVLTGVALAPWLVALLILLLPVLWLARRTARPKTPKS